MKSNLLMLCTLCAVLLCATFATAQPTDSPTPAESGNASQMAEIGEQPGEPGTPAEATPEPAAAVATVAKPVVKSDEFIVLGYPQNLNPADSYMWHGLTHMTTTFMDFDETGTIINPTNWTSRHSTLQRGGTADKYGVKVLMCVRNEAFELPVITTVMADPALRTKLADQIMALVNDANSNAAGVTFDLEPAGYGSISAGLVSFFQDMQTRLAGKELSLYAGPSYNSGYTGYIGTWLQYMDYFIYSCYPWSGSWAGSTTLGAVSPLSSYKGALDTFISNGVPPEKIVLALSAYGGETQTLTGAYGATIVNAPNRTSLGFTKAKFNTTLSANKQTRQYQTGQEAAWYSAFNGTSYDTAVYDDEISIAMKARGAISWQGAQNPGRRLRGIGYWSMMWMSDNYWDSFQSRDLETNTNVAYSSNRTRTYPHIYQAHNETLAPPGTRTFPIEKWEHIEGRWRQPHNGPDTIGCTVSTITAAATPAGTGQPAESANCALAAMTFTAVANNRCFFRHEILGHFTENTVPDRNAVKALFDKNTRLDVDVYTASAYAGRTIRYMMMDANGELEMGPQETLNAAGWRTLSFDLTRTGVSAYTTAFKQFKSGNGVLDTVVGARDLACVGFLIEGGGTAGAVNLHLDELRYTKIVPPGREYVINEFRHNPTTAQFVEIYGPAGTFPSGMQLKLVQSSDGAAYSTIDLSGRTVPNDRSGYGYFVVGSTATPNVDLVIANALITSAATGALQLYDSSTGFVCDSLVYRAHSGLFALDGDGDPRVTQNGYPWVGGLGDGIGGNGAVYSVGRPVDGANTYINYADFSSMIGTPGATNDAAVALPVTYNFSAVPATGVQTFQTMAVVASGVGASPSGGNVYRCVDTTGGGVQAFIGGPAFGASTNGYSVTGEVYIPATTAPVQSIGIGFCGNRGSSFFSATTASGAYEDGYWLIFENAAGAALADDRPDHPGVFEFVQAHNNNMHPKATTLLASKTLANVGLAATGGWTTFKFDINPANNTLTATINNVTVYSGAIPAKGPKSGAFQVGFRENHTGNPVAAEGTWIDNLNIIPNNGAIKITLSGNATGAQWSIDNGATWNNSDVTLSNLSAVNYTVTFKPIAGFNTPASQVVAVTGGATATFTGAYARPTAAQTAPADGTAIKGLASANVAFTWTGNSNYDIAKIVLAKKTGTSTFTNGTNFFPAATYNANTRTVAGSAIRSEKTALGLANEDSVYWTILASDGTQIAPGYFALDEFVEPTNPGVSETKVEDPANPGTYIAMPATWPPNTTMKNRLTLGANQHVVAILYKGVTYKLDDRNPAHTDGTYVLGLPQGASAGAQAPTPAAAAGHVIFTIPANEPKIYSVTATEIPIGISTLEIE